MRSIFQDQNPEPKAAGKNPIALRIIEAVEKSYDVTMEDAETSLRVIKENQQPMQFKAPFEVSERTIATQSQSARLEETP